MREINLPPFYVGQKVVAIKNHNNRPCFRKGNEYIVHNVKQICDCGIWEVDVGERSQFLSGSICRCGKTHQVYGIFWYSADYFAPIEQTFQSITFKEVIKVESQLIGIN